MIGIDNTMALPCVCCCTATGNCESLKISWAEPYLRGDKDLADYDKSTGPGLLSELAVVQQYITIDV